METAPPISLSWSPAPPLLRAVRRRAIRRASIFLPLALIAFIGTCLALRQALGYLIPDALWADMVLKGSPALFIIFGLAFFAWVYDAGQSFTYHLTPAGLSWGKSSLQQLTWDRIATWYTFPDPADPNTLSICITLINSGRKLIRLPAPPERDAVLAILGQFANRSADNPTPPGYIPPKVTIPFALLCLAYTLTIGFAVPTHFLRLCAPYMLFASLLVGPATPLAIFCYFHRSPRDARTLILAFGANASCNVLAFVLNGVLYLRAVRLAHPAL
ncbi:MAG: hypothetical protein ACM359_17875 [Bacillota bacterium]